MKPPVKVLFMCVANSARSQLAEGLARKLLGAAAWVESAGSQPSRVNPLAVQALAEVGVDATTQVSKSVAQLPANFVAQVDWVITLCAEEVCPVFVSQRAKRLHWPFPDPAGHTESPQAQLERFRQVREGLQSRLESFARDILLI